MRINGHGEQTFSISLVSGVCDLGIQRALTVTGQQPHMLPRGERIGGTATFKVE